MTPHPSPKRSTATLRDVAQRLKISYVTVWRALQNSPKVSVALREEIRKVAQEMGYRPNPAAATLVQYRTASKTKPIEAVLAWFNFWPDPKKLGMVPLFAANWQGAVEAAESFGYRVEEFICKESFSPEKLKRILVARGIQGILLPPQRPPISREDFDFDWNQFAAIRIGHTVAYPLVHMVTHAQASNTLEALGKIQEKGYQRIGYVTSVTIRSFALFDAGYLKARAKWPKKDQLPILTLEDWAGPSPAVLQELDTWMKKNRPDAILSTEGNIVAMLTAAGYRVPEDVAVAATSVTASDADAGMFENPKEVGRVAAKNLVTLIQRSELGIPEFRQNILVRGNWQDGSSLPDRR